MQAFEIASPISWARNDERSQLKSENMSLLSLSSSQVLARPKVFRSEGEKSAAAIGSATGMSRPCWQARHKRPSFVWFVCSSQYPRPHLMHFPKDGFSQ